MADHLFMVPVRPAPESFGEYLRRLREQWVDPETGEPTILSQTQLAKRSGIAQNRLSDWENNKYQPEFESLRALEKFYRMTPGSLYRIMQDINVNVALAEEQSPRRIPGPAVAAIEAALFSGLPELD